MVKEHLIRLTFIFSHIPQVVHCIHVKLKRELNLSLKRSSTTRTKNKQKSTFISGLRLFLLYKNGRSYLSKISQHIFSICQFNISKNKI
jgi:hypothetical protein